MNAVERQVRLRVARLTEHGGLGIACLREDARRADAVALEAHQLLDEAEAELRALEAWLVERGNEAA